MCGSKTLWKFGEVRVSAAFGTVWRVGNRMCPARNAPRGSRSNEKGYQVVRRATWERGHPLKGRSNLFLTRVSKNDKHLRRDRKARPPPKATGPQKIPEYSIDYSVSQLSMPARCLSGGSDKWLYVDQQYPEKFLAYRPPLFMIYMIESSFAIPTSWAFFSIDTQGQI